MSLLTELEKKSYRVSYKYFAPSGAKNSPHIAEQVRLQIRPDPSAYADGTDIIAHSRSPHAVPAKHALQLRFRQRATRALQPERARQSLSSRTARCIAALHG